MADQVARLEMIVDSAEQGMRIIHRFVNDSASAGAIPTNTGAIKNLKRVAEDIKSYGQEAADSAVGEVVDHLKSQTQVEGLIIALAGETLSAGASAARSELAAGLAGAAVNLKLTVADGLLATSGSGPNNRFFSVSSNDKVLSILYRNDNNAAVEIGRSASSLAVSEVSVRLSEIEPGALRLGVDSTSNDLMEFTDGSPERARLARFDRDGFWRPEKHEPAVQNVLNAVETFDTGDDLLRELDASDDQVLLRRVDRNGVNHGKWEGEFPARLESAGSLAAAAFTAASEALAAVGSGPWDKLKQLMQTSFVHGLNPVLRPTLGLTAIVTTTLPEGLSKAINVGRTPEAFAFIGGTPMPYGSWYGFKAVTRLNGTGNLGGNNSALQWSVEVMVDAVAPAFRVLGNADEFRFIVDGQYYSDAVITATAGGGNCWIQLPFAKRAVRRIRICGTGRFGGVAVGPTESAWHPGDANRLRVSFIGDSFTDGAQSSGPDRSWTTQLAYLCGISNPWAVANGGTGYVSVGAGLGNFGSEARINDVIASNPEMLFFAGSVNDRQNTVAEIQAAALAAWRAYRLTFPDIPFVIFGCPTPATGIPADAIKVDNALADAFAMWGDSNADFVRVTTDPQGPWLFGTGYISSNPATSNGSGNNDVYMGRVEVNDGTHPNNPGHVYLARRKGQSLYQIALTK